jgi:hypothetical protein
VLAAACQLVAQPRLHWRSAVCVCVCVCVSVGGGRNWEMCVAVSCVCAGKNVDGLWGPHGPIEPHGPMGPTRPIKTYNIVKSHLHVSEVTLDRML